MKLVESFLSAKEVSSLFSQTHPTLGRPASLTKFSPFFFFFFLSTDIAFCTVFNLFINSKFQHLVSNSEGEHQQILIPGPRKFNLGNS